MFYTTDLHNTKTRSKLNKHKTKPYLIFDDHIGETEKVKKEKQTSIYTGIQKLYTYCLQSFPAEIKHMVKKYLTSYLF